MWFLGPGYYNPVDIWYLAKLSFKLYIMFLGLDKLFEKMDMPLETTYLGKKTT